MTTFPVPDHFTVGALSGIPDAVGDCKPMEGAKNQNAETATASALGDRSYQVPMSRKGCIKEIEDISGEEKEVFPHEKGIEAMSMNWNPKQELALARILLDRTVSRDHPESKLPIPTLQLVDDEGPAHLAMLAVEMPLSRGMTVRIFDTIPRDMNSLERLEEVVGGIAERLHDLHDEREEITAQLKLLRNHLSRKLSSWRRRGLRIKGSISPAYVEAPIDRDTVPIVHLRLPDETLRMAGVEFEAHDTQTLDERLAEATQDLEHRSGLMNDLEGLGAIGLIHPVLDALLEKEPDRAELLKGILADPERFQDIVLSSGRKAVVYWDEGVLTCTYTFEDGTSFRKNEVTLPEGREPPSDIVKPVPLDDIVSLPIVSKLPIKAFRNRSYDGRRTTIRVEAMALLIMADGKTRPIDAA